MSDSSQSQESGQGPFATCASSIWLLEVPEPLVSRGQLARESPLFGANQPGSQA